MDKDRIKDQAKKMMDEFMVALEKAEDIDIPFGLEREENMRVPSKSQKDPDFRKRMFRNAPKVDNDCIVAEKKSW